MYTNKAVGCLQSRQWVKAKASKQQPLPCRNSLHRSSLAHLRGLGVPCAMSLSTSPEFPYRHYARLVTADEFDSYSITIWDHVDHWSRDPSYESNSTLAEHLPIGDPWSVLFLPPRAYPRHVIYEISRWLLEEQCTYEGAPLEQYEHVDQARRHILAARLFLFDKVNSQAELSDPHRAAVYQQHRQQYSPAPEDLIQAAQTLCPRLGNTTQTWPNLDWAFCWNEPAIGPSFTLSLLSVFLLLITIWNAPARSDATSGRQRPPSPHLPRLPTSPRLPSPPRLSPPRRSPRRRSPRSREPSPSHAAPSPHASPSPHVSPPPAAPLPQQALPPPEAQHSPEPPPQPPTCARITKGNTQCQKKPQRGSIFCHQHRPSS